MSTAQESEEASALRSFLRVAARDAGSAAAAPADAESLQLGWATPPLPLSDCERHGKGEYRTREQRHSAESLQVGWATPPPCR